MDIMDIKEIQKTLPHRYPFLMLDRILELKKGEYIKAVKNVTINEPFFQGHYPDSPIMPGVMIIEAMAQAGAFLALKTLEDRPGKRVPLFTGIEKARFKQPVVPGDVIIFEGKVMKKRGSIWWIDCTARVEGKLVCRAELLAAFVEKEE